MQFLVIAKSWAAPTGKKSCVVLMEDEWDDWFEFSTMYTLYIFEDNGVRHEIGSVKIGQFGMKEKQRRPELPQEFEALDDRFFSLGQDDSYYAQLNELVPNLRDEILQALRDLPFSDALLFEVAQKERVTHTSLLRSVSRGTVRDQFRRIALGGVRLLNINSRILPPLLARRGLARTFPSKCSQTHNLPRIFMSSSGAMG
jgi:hypothetical protein